MSIVYTAYDLYLRDKRKNQNAEYNRKHAKPTAPSLWPTDLGKCHRAAILRVTGTRGDDTFSTRSLDYMNAGTIYEDETANVLRHMYGNRLQDQVELKYLMWSGKADFGIDIGTETPILIEHKVTSEKNWDSDSNTELPKHEHIGQILTYRWLYERLYGVTPRTILFYKAWGNFAEFELLVQENSIQIVSMVNGIGTVKKYEYDVEKEIEDLMLAYNNTNELPDRLDKKYKGCTFAGKPSCQFYNKCWGD